MRTQCISGHGIVLAAVAAGAAACAAPPLRVPMAPQPASGVAVPPPQLEIDGHPHWTRGFDAAYAVALRNLHQPNSFHRTMHARAAPSIFGVHLWDSAFLSHIWKTWDVRVAQQINRAVLDQARDGRVPHFSHRILRSDLTQPPVIAWSIWENFLWSSDTAYLAAVYAPLREYDAWLEANRMLPSGLFYWHSPLESGMDNSPRFDPQTRRARRDLRTVAAVDLSSYVVLQRIVLARIAEVLGEAEQSRHFDRSAAELRDRVNRLLWDERTGYYYDRDETTGQLIELRTAASFLPLFAGIPDAAQARRMRDHIVDPAAFNSPLPLPTVALDEPSYGKDMWRGPVWINVSYMIIRGLDAYGYAADAADLAFRTVDGVYRTFERTGGMWEFYDAERFDIDQLDRKRGERLKQITLGNKPLPEYGWTALVNTLVVEYLVGYRREGERRYLTPRLPPAAGGKRMRLTLPDDGIRIALQVGDDGSVQGEVQVGGEWQRFELSFGEVYQVPASRALAAAGFASAEQ